MTITQAFELPIYFPRPLRNAYDVHAAVYRAMQSQGEGASRDFIFDLLYYELPGSFYALVRSARKPPSGVPAQVSVPTSGRHQFSLRAEARKSTQNGITNDEDRQEWMRRQGERHGFSLVGDVVMKTQRRHFRKRTPRKNFVVLETLFHGTLEITDADRFSAAWLNGIGASRAFGYGLLNVLPDHR